jgi:hypothetical protein
MVPNGWQRSRSARALLGVPQAASQEWQTGRVKEEYILLSLCPPTSSRAGHSNVFSLPQLTVLMHQPHCLRHLACIARIIETALRRQEPVVDAHVELARHRRSSSDVACHDVLDGYRASNTTAAMSTSAAMAPVTSPPSLDLRGSARRRRRPCRPRV